MGYALSVDIIINDCSCAGGSESLYEGRALMNHLLSTIREAIGCGCGRYIRVSKDLQEFTLAPDYTIQRWRNDPAVPKEEKQYFSALATRIPVDADVPPSIGDASQVTDVSCLGFTPSLSLKIGYLLNGLLISFKSDKKCGSSRIEVVVSSLTEDGTIHTLNDSLPNACIPEHLGIHNAWITERKMRDVTSSADLWGKKRELFPSLSFADSTRGQILNLDLKRVKAVKKALDLLSTNLKHPGLNIHKYDDKVGANGEEVWEAYAENNTPGAYRIFFHHVSGGLNIISIEPHPEY